MSTFSDKVISVNEKFFSSQNIALSGGSWRQLLSTNITRWIVHR